MTAIGSSIIIYTKGASNKNVQLFEYINNFNLINKCSADFFLKQKDYLINIEALKHTNTISLLEKIELNSIQLNLIADVKAGLVAYEVGAGIPPQTKEVKEKRIYHARSKLSEDYFRYLDGKDVCRYYLNWSGDFLKYGKHLSRCRSFSLFSTQRILVRQIPSTPPYCINACLTEDIILNDRNSMNIINIKEIPKLVLAILNSRLVSYWFVHKFGKMQRGTFPQFKVNELAIFPIPKNFAPYREILITKVNQILAAKRDDSAADISTLSQEIDQLVYELYELTDEEIAIMEGQSPK